MTEDEQEEIRANPGYAAAQLAKALLGTGSEAKKRVQQWQQVVAGMAQGVLQIGSRTPLAGSRPWVTLEVVHGGFATGHCAAGGELKRHEIEKLLDLQKRGVAPNTGADMINVTSGRTVLNVYFAGQDGLPELADMIRSGCFRVHVPEEAALLISAWLQEKGETERATELLEVLGPFVDKLRFYPEPNKQPLRLISGDMVYLQPAGRCVSRLREKRQQQSVIKMNEAIKVWAPLYDRAVSLFLETVEGDIPELSRDQTSGELVRAENGQPLAVGGWPCKHYPIDWMERASALLKDYDQACFLHGLCKKHEKPKENFARLRNYLATISKNPATLSARDLGIIRKILASYVTAHGAPGSERLQATRLMQAEMCSRPLHATMARVLADRLEDQPADEGIPELQRLLVPLSADEAVKIGMSAGIVFPASIIRKALACGEAPLGTLIQQKLIASSEAMALVLPMLTARIRAARVSDPDLARVFESVYRAFRKRRSLLLLKLASQVRFEELPWISAVEPWVGSGEDSRAAARAAFTQATSLAISAFPYTILPNKLLKELRTLAKDAEITVPLVDELAADIFMGSFSANFLHAAHGAARLLQGTLYERYYGIDYEHAHALNDSQKKWGAQVSPGFGRICVQMAANELAGGGSVANNGAIIEQGQIVTTHNLSSLWRALDLDNAMKSELTGLARSCYQWICRRQQIRVSEWQTELRSIKNCAYAWRQMLFYLSLCNEDEQKQFISWASEHLSAQSDEFKERFAPAMQGLLAIAGGERFDNQGNHSSGGKRFLGWSTRRHFLRR